MEYFIKKKALVKKNIYYKFFILKNASEKIAFVLWYF